MKEFVENFSKMMDYGFLGVYRRQKMSEENVQTRFVAALAKACAIGAFLNLKYELYKDGEPILPQTEYQIFRMFELPLKEIIDDLPEKYRRAVKERTNYFHVEALLERIGNGKVIITEEGYIMLAESKLHASKDEIDQISEYNGQLIYEELCKGDYVKNRHFLECGENVYIPGNLFSQSEEQTKLRRAYPELFNMCYVKNTRTSLYRCKRCGMVLRENKIGVFSCVSQKCNAQINKKKEIEMHGPGWVMNDIVARNIYYPGQLEQRIKKILETGKEIGTVEQYELWPGKYEGIYDTWDFKVQKNNGRILLIDAKDVENPHWIINDKREFLEGAEFIYVVPDDKSKIYMNQINDHASCVGKVQCLRIKELKKLIEVK